MSIYGYRLALYVFVVAAMREADMLFLLHWFLLFAVTLIELVCRKIRAMFNRMPCENHTPTSRTLTASYSICEMYAKRIEMLKAFIQRAFSLFTAFDAIS